MSRRPDLQFARFFVLKNARKGAAQQQFAPPVPPGRRHLGPHGKFCVAADWHGLCEWWLQVVVPLPLTA